MGRRNMAVPLALAMFAMRASHTEASLVFYANQAAFDAATTGVTTNDFEGIAPDGGFVNPPTPPGLTDGAGVNYDIDHANNNGNLYVIGKDFYYSGNSVLSSQQSSSGTDNFVITLPGAFTAFALDLSGFVGLTVTFTLSTGDAFDIIPPAYPDLTFVGVTSDTPFTTIRLDQSVGDVLNIDNFSFGAADVSAVPEPASITLAGMGAAGLLIGAIRRRRQQQAA